jgi:16S rRNA (guanine527-N7)-methyltransferase
VNAPQVPEFDRLLLDRLEPMLAMLAAAPASLSSVTDLSEARRIHVRDSLSGLLVSEIEEGGRAIDIGSGAGFPGIPLAAALPDVHFDLLDSVGRKVEFMDQVIAKLGLGNAGAVKARSEDWAAGEGSGAYGVATARAVAPLTVLAELASPLLAEGGSLVAWKGGREVDQERALAGLGPKLAMGLDRFVEVRPFEGSRVRHLYVVRKTGPTPDGLPRRPGMARKRPLTL